MMNQGAIQKKPNRTIFFLSFLMVFCFSPTYSQITPPGLGDGCSNTWFAIGLNQRLSQKNNWKSKSYIGLGRTSGIETRNPFLKRGIFIINQAFSTPFKKNWSAGFGVSYRRKNIHENVSPTLEAQPSVEQEFRGFGKVEYTYSHARLKLQPSLKQEIRKFYTPDFQSTGKLLALRTRFRLKFTIALDKNKAHKIILVSEQLFPMSQQLATKKWSNLHYKESRFSLFYSYSLEHFPITLEVGYTNQLVGTQKAHSNHYCTFDVVLNNLFSRKERKD